jgi:ABC-2 type transport system permease protein
MRTLVVQRWSERRRSILGWAAGWAVLVAMYVATWPTVRAHAEQYDGILRDLPAPLRAAIGSQAGGAFSTSAGYFTAELLAVTGPVLAMTMGVLLGAGAMAREEEDGTLELLLAQPVSRTKVLLARALEAALELLAVLLVAGCVLFALGTLVDLRLGLGTCLRATGMLALLGTEGLALGLLVGALSGRPGRSRAIAGGAALGAFLLNALGPSIGWLSGLVVISPFHTLVAGDPFRRVPPTASIGTLLAPSLLLLAVACVGFRRRDLRLR